MKSSLVVGLTGEARHRVVTENLVSFRKPGMPPVLCSPWLLQILEDAAYAAVQAHLDPGEAHLSATVRIDGVLHCIERLPAALAPQVVGRLKALADLLAYRTDIPQEGRIPADRCAAGVEVRVATYPTLSGERVALRFDTPAGRPQDLG